MKRTSRGFTLIELLVVIAIIALLMGLLLPALAKALGTARVRKDQGQIKGIASSYSIFAETDDKKRYPLGGYINRLALELPEGYGNVYQGIDSGQQVQGAGKPDFLQNTSSTLHSYCIGANYYGPEILISANEQNPIVTAKGDSNGILEEDPYDYSAVNASDDSYWDPSFSADISQGSEVCHVSYANMALCGKRLDYWRDGGSDRVILASRAPQMDTADEVMDEVLFGKSRTLHLYGPTEQWEGIFVVADGSSHYANDFWLNSKEYLTRGEYTIFKDNCYMAEFTDYGAAGASGDNWLALHVDSTEDSVIPLYDELLP